ncbi:hypothetical protein LTR56_007235 [Elasticomyces elasticus]|nr:hypothetical protein LTR56_007235 [Elasticomyces elasticus]KAK4914489.1 hypothetical protein LTR49_017294 [Elasticomyces elasticus]KAK5753489.1 hypothetical protein LTS12_016441 [Elasticomyces elasticus]
MSRLPPQTRDQLQPAQQDLHDHFNSAVRRAVGKDPGNVDTTSHQDSSQAAIGGPFPFLSVLPSIGRLSLDMIAGLGQVLPEFPPDARETASLERSNAHRCTNRGNYVRDQTKRPQSRL